MENIFYLLFLSLFFWYFMYLRKVSEAARTFTLNYCQDKELQFISIARQKTKLKFNTKQGWYLYSLYDFEFSGDGQSSYLGSVSLTGLRLNEIDLPAYRVQH